MKALLLIIIFDMSVDRTNYTLVCRNYCTNNYQDVLQSTCIACLYCKNEIFKEKPNKKLGCYDRVHKEWIFETILEENGETVRCPMCGIDAVIGNKTTKWTRKDIEYWNEKGFCSISDEIFNL